MYRRTGSARNAAVNAAGVVGECAAMVFSSCGGSRIGMVANSAWSAASCS